MVTEYCNTLDCFGFIQNVNQATHILGHTLDHIMSYGILVDAVQVENASFSDHIPIVLNVSLGSSAVFNNPIGSYLHFITPLTVLQFSESFTDIAAETAILSAAEFSCGTDQLISLFYTFCFNILDSNAPLKFKCTKRNTNYWLDDNAHSLRCLRIVVKLRGDESM